MNIPEAMEQYRDYPDGTAQKKLYDYYLLPFQEYLSKYYNSETSFEWPEWERWIEWINAAYDDKKRNAFKQKTGYYRINMNFEAMIKFYNSMEFGYLPEDIKKVIVFLKFDGFFDHYNIEIHDWLNLRNFRNPKHETSRDYKSINELLALQLGDNYVRGSLMNLYWWFETRGDPQGT